MHNIILEEGVVEEEEEGGILQARRANNSKEKSMIFIAYNAIEVGMMLPLISFLEIELSKKEMKEEVK